MTYHNFFKPFLTSAILPSLLLATAALPTRAEAQSTLTQVPVSFTGTVTTGSDGTVMLRQSDGTTIPFTGTLPSSAYQAGSTVSISFNAYMPNKAYYDTTPFPKPTDGIYRVALVTQGSAGCCSSTNVGTTSNPVISVNGQALGGSGAVQSIKMTLVYDYNTDAYSIDTGTTFGTSAYVGSGYRFDSATGELVSCLARPAIRITAQIPLATSPATASV